MEDSYIEAVRQTYPGAWICVASRLPAIVCGHCWQGYEYLIGLDTFDAPLV